MSAGYSNRPIATCFWLRIQGRDLCLASGIWRSEKRLHVASASIHQTAGRFEEARRTTAWKRIDLWCLRSFCAHKQTKVWNCPGQSTRLHRKIEEIDGNSSLGSVVDFGLAERKCPSVCDFDLPFIQILKHSINSHLWKLKLPKPQIFRSFGNFNLLI